MIVQSLNAGMSKWSDIAAKIPGRNRKQCRERWFGHLDPNVKKEQWTSAEDASLQALHAQMGKC